MDERIVQLFLYLEQFEFIRFLGATGVSGAIFAVIYFPQQWFTKTHYRASLYWAFVPSLIAGFVMHKYWTFRDVHSDFIWLQMSLYTTKRIVFIRVNDYLLQWFVERRGISSTLAQAIIAGTGVSLNYAVTKLIFSL